MAVYNLEEPAGLAIDETAGAVFVANSANPARSVERYDLASVLRRGATPSSEILVSGLERPAGLQLGPDGQLYISYENSGRGLVGRVDPLACAARSGCGPGDVTVVLDAGLAAPLAGLTVTDGGRLFIHTAYSPEIYSVVVHQ